LYLARIGSRAQVPRERSYPLWNLYCSRGLDKDFRPVRIILNKALFMPVPCDHNRTQIIARRDGVDYVECLDCRQIFEAEDLEPVKVEEDEE